MALSINKNPHQAGLETQWVKEEGFGGHTVFHPSMLIHCGTIPRGPFRCSQVPEFILQKSPFHPSSG